MVGGAAWRSRLVLALPALSTLAETCLDGLQCSGVIRFSRTSIEIEQRASLLR
jgi:hypothetical protein